MASQYDQNGTRQDFQHEQRSRTPHSSAEAQYGQSPDYGYDDRFAGQDDYSRHQRGGDPGRWARDRPGHEFSGYDREGSGNQLTRDPSFPPPIRYGGERGRERGGPWAGSQGYDERAGGEHAGVFAYQRHGPSGRPYGRSESGGYGQGGGYAQSAYGQGGYTQGAYDQRDFGQGGFGMGGSGPRRPEQDQAMQGLAHYDQDYNSPYRGAYGQGGYGGRSPGQQWSGRRGQPGAYGGQGLQDAGAGGYNQGSFELDDDGPIEAGYLGDSDRGNWARNYQGEGSRGSSMGYSTRRHGGSGYAEQTGSRGQQSGSQGSFRGKGPRGYMRSDERLCEDINERLTDDDYIDASDISVDVKDGVVTLSGEVEQRRLKHRIEDLVERCHGVQDIRNEIRVKRGGQEGARDDSATGGSAGRARSAIAGSSTASGTVGGQSPASAGFSGQRSGSDESSRGSTASSAEQDGSSAGGKKK